MPFDMRFESQTEQYINTILSVLMAEFYNRQVSGDLIIGKRLSAFLACVAAGWGALNGGLEITIYTYCIGRASVGEIEGSSP